MSLVHLIRHHSRDPDYGLVVRHGGGLSCMKLFAPMLFRLRMVRLSHFKALVSMTFVRHTRALSVHHLSLKWLLRHFRSCQYRSHHSW